MDDRFRSEDIRPEKTNKNTPVKPPYYSAKPTPLGDFSENIQSKTNQTKTPGAPVTVSAQQKPKKFEVHLPESADLIPDIKPSQNNSPVLKEVTGKQYIESQQYDPVSLKKPSAQAKPDVKSAAPVKQSVKSSPAASDAKAPASTPKTASSGSAVQRKRAASKGNSVQKGRTLNRKTQPAKKNLTPEQARKLRAKKKYNFINSVLTICVCVIFITIITVTASTVAMATINDILSIDKEGGHSVSVIIPEGAEYEEVFDILKDNGLVKQPFVTNIFCKYRHYDEIEIYDQDGKYVETRRIKYVPGTYYLESNAGIEVMLEEIMVRSNNAKDTARLTFPEGWTIAQIFEKIEKYNVCEAEKLYANLEIVGNQYDFISEIPAVSGRYLKSEGYLFPDTYDFFIGENASSILKKLFNNFEAKWSKEYDKKLKSLDMTMDVVITIASIIQREAKDTSQMALISSVIHNRLKDSATYPLIEMNSTKDYVLSLKEFNLFSDFYYNLYLNSYNTYSNRGLPPGPICNPGAAAIKAALYPSDTDYKFFCHDNKGEIYLARTASEHQANTAKVLYSN